MTSSYQIPIMTCKLEELLKNSREHPTLKNARYLNVPFLHVFENQINDFERIQVKLRPSNGLIYPTVKRCMIIVSCNININSFIFSTELASVITRDVNR